MVWIITSSARVEQYCGTRRTDPEPKRRATSGEAEEIPERDEVQTAEEAENCGVESPGCSNVIAGNRELRE